MGDDDEVMRFEITDQDLEDEARVGFGSSQPKMSKHQAIYGIWADDDHDSDENRPSFGGRKSKRDSKTSYTTPVGFVSAGVSQKSKEDADGDEIKSDSSDSEEDRRVRQKASNKFRSSGSMEGQIAGLRTAKFQSKASLGKGFGEWEKHTKGIGAKLLLKMGFQAGKGLGKDLQGRTSIVEAHLRKGKGAIGAYGHEGGGPKMQKARVDSEEEEEKSFHKKLHQWKKINSNSSKNSSNTNYVYRSVEDVLDERKWRSSSIVAPTDTNQVKVIDMTGKEQRILSGYHSIANRKIMPDEEIDDSVGAFNATSGESQKFDIPALRHNLNLLVNICEEDLINADRKIRHLEDRIPVLEKQEEELSQILDREIQAASSLQKLLKTIEDLEALGSSLDLHSCLLSFQAMRNDFPEDYIAYEIPFIASSLVAPLLRELLRDWRGLEQPTLHTAAFYTWQEMLTIDPDHPEGDPYSNLVWETWMPKIRLTIGEQWDARLRPDALVGLMDVWNDLLPKWISQNVRSHLILPKLEALVDAWNPMTDDVPIHTWLHPWLPSLGSELEVVYPIIRNKLALALSMWHPSDKSAKLIILPWIDVFKQGPLSVFLYKNIVPKLEMMLQQNLVINPSNQSLQEWKWLMEWNGVLSPVVISNILEKEFFPKWMRALASWLNSCPNYDEVTAWYKGWKSLIPSDISSLPSIKHFLNQALEIMNRSVSSPMAPLSRQPGALESFRYLASVESSFIQSASKPIHSDTQSSLSPNLKPTVPISLDFKDLVAKKCLERGINFVPVNPIRTHQGKIIYKCGNLHVYLERNVIFVLQKTTDVWVPSSLNMLLDAAL